MRCPRANRASQAAIAVFAIGALADASPGGFVRVVAPARVEVYVPAGRFLMGVDEDTASAVSLQCTLQFKPLTGFQGPTRTPVDFCADYHATLLAMAPRSVFLDGFFIDRDEVSVREYRTCVQAGGCDPDPLFAGDVRYIRDEWPLVNVTWHEANDFCRWRGGRLPTEAEWERAARGDDPNAAWPWGELERPKDFNHGQPRAEVLRTIDRTPSIVPLQFFGDPDDSDGNAVLAPPGSYAWGTSPFGTRDQAGNVAEWTSDAYVFEPHAKGYDGLPAANPIRIGTHLDPRVARGGSWRQPTLLARSNLRDPFNKEYEPSGRFHHIGFRCARTPNR